MFLFAGEFVEGNNYIRQLSFCLQKMAAILKISPVWLYIANLIGYTRVILGLAAFVFAFDSSFSTQRGLFIYFYVISYFLDACDGVAARALRQTSKFGAVLDMATDRICTAGLLALLSHYASISVSIKSMDVLNPLSWPPFIWIWIAMLDIFSHWLQMYSSLLSGSASHKAMTDEVSFVRWYYTLPYALFFVCLAHESFLTMTLVTFWAAQKGSIAAVPFPFNLKIVPFMPSSTVAEFVREITLPFFAFKTLVSILQMITAAQRIVTIDEKIRVESLNESTPSMSIGDTEIDGHYVSVASSQGRGREVMNAATSTSTSTSSSSSRRRRPSSVPASALVALSSQARSGIADLMAMKEARMKKAKEESSSRPRSASRARKEG